MKTGRPVSIPPGDGVQESGKRLSLSNLGEGLVNCGYIVVEKDSMLDVKGLSFSMPRLLDYLGTYRA